MLKKLLEKVGLLVFGLIVVAIALFSLFLGFGSVADMVIKIVSIVGGGSIVKGIIAAPFFVFGIVQIVRGACSIINSDIKKIDETDESLWHYLYIPATLAGYIVVILAFCNWVAAA